MIPSNVWEEELTAVARARGVPRQDLEALVCPCGEPPDPGAEAGPDPAATGRPGHPASDGAMAESAGRLLVSAAEALEEGGCAAARGDAFCVLVLIAELFDLSSLREWTARLSGAADCEARAMEAARVLREAAALVAGAGNVAPLRGLEWEWPGTEPRPAPPAAAEPVAIPEPVAVPETPAVPEPIAQAEPAASAAPRAEPPPSPEPVVVAPPGQESEPLPAAPIPRPAPPVPIARPAPPISIHAPAPPHAVLRRALIVEQSAIAAGFLARQLAQRGLDVLVVTEPSAAARALAEGGFAAVFVAENLPGGAEPLLSAHPEWSERAVLLGRAGGGRRPAGLAGVPLLIQPSSEEEITHTLASLAARRRSQGAAPGTKGDA